MLIDLPNTTESLSEIALPLPKGHERVVIEGGARGTEQTITLMQKMVNAYKRNDDIRALAGKIIKDAEPKNYLDYAKRLYQWVRDNIKYAYDPHLVEYIESPLRVLKNRIGDCDSQDMLLASLFENLGLKAQFVTIMADDTRPNEFTHVYTRVFIPKYGWIVADPIMHKKYFGWEPPYPNGKRYWHGSFDEVGSPLDTSESVAIMSPDQIDSMAGSGSNPNSGMSGLGRGGRGGRGRRGGWGGGYGPGWGYGGDTIILPIAVPDQYVVVDPDSVLAQSENNPSDQSVGMGDIGNFGANDSTLSQSEARSWISRVLDGSLASQLLSEKTKAQELRGNAFSAVAKAEKLPSGALKDKALAAAKTFDAASLKSLNAINDAVSKYSDVVRIIQTASMNTLKPRQISGLGVEPISITAMLAVAGVIVAITAMSVAVAYYYDYAKAALVAKSESDRALNNATAGFISEITADIKSGKTTPSQGIEAINKLKNLTSSSSTGLFDSIGSSIFTTGMVGLGLYALYRFVNYQFGGTKSDRIAASTRMPI